MNKILFIERDGKEYTVCSHCRNTIFFLYGDLDTPDLMRCSNCLKDYELIDSEYVEVDFHKHKVSKKWRTMEEYEFFMCPECGSSNVFDLETMLECDECGHTWSKPQNT